MARTKYYIQEGLLTKKNDGSVAGLFDLTKFIKRELDHNHVTFNDPCCDEDKTVFPVQFNSENSTLEYFDGTEQVVVPVALFPTAAQNDIAAGTGGAISVTNYLTTINTDAGGDTFTLPDGNTAGQLKKILLVVDGGGNGVVTPASLTGGTTITFGDANDYVILRWSGTSWEVIENIGTTIA